jgi:hypothetical protein
MRLFFLIFLSFLTLPGCATEKDLPAIHPIYENELVMTEGLEIEAKTKNGKIKIKALNGLHRTYTWENTTRSAELGLRKTRWYGSYGAYYPGPGYHWKEYTRAMSKTSPTG